MDEPDMKFRLLLDMTPMSAFYRIIRILVPLAAATVLLSGCGSYRDIRNRGLPS